MIIENTNNFKGLLIGHRPNQDSNNTYVPKDLDIFTLITDYKAH